MTRSGSPPSVDEFSTLFFTGSQCINTFFAYQTNQSGTSSKETTEKRLLKLSWILPFI